MQYLWTILIPTTVHVMAAANIIAIDSMITQRLRILVPIIVTSVKIAVHSRQKEYKSNS